MGSNISQIPPQPLKPEEIQHYIEMEKKKTEQEYERTVKLAKEQLEQKISEQERRRESNCQGIMVYFNADYICYKTHRQKSMPLIYKECMKEIMELGYECKVEQETIFEELQHSCTDRYYNCHCNTTGKLVSNEELFRVYDKTNH